VANQEVDPYPRAVKLGLQQIATRLKAPASALHILTAAAAIGIAAFLAVYGLRHLLGTSAYWEVPEQDERMAVMGYRYFLADTWHWPVFLNHAINVPYAKSVAFLDCIPVWALLNKAIATIIPPWASFTAHAYLGLWHCLAYALQPVFGVACLRALGHRSWREGIVAALFFIAVPTWIFRYPHPALSAHWILLWALYLYLRTPERGASPRALSVAKLCQLAVASLVTPYLAVMSLTVFAASLARSRHPRTILTWLPLGIACAGLASWLAGYFAPETAYAQWGFEWQSANVLGWLIPQRSGILGDAQWIASAEGTPWQYEGYAYLGLGVLGLLALLIPRIASVLPVLSRHRILFIVIAGSLLLALSSRVFFGSHEIVSYRVPRLLRWIPHQFRSPGRFVWIPTYALIVLLLRYAFARFATGWRFAVVAVAAALQVVDATGDWRVQSVKTSGPYGPILDLARWRPLVHAHSAVVILPTYTCVFDEDDASRYDHLSTEIQLLASERALPINGTYSARAMRRCADEERAWPTLALEAGTLYVLLPQALAIADRFEAAGGHCGVFDSGRVCSTHDQAISQAIRSGSLRPAPPPIALAYGQKLALAEQPSIDAGWSPPDAGGRWTRSSISSVLLHLDGDPPPRPSLKIQLRPRLCGSRTAQDVDILLDDKALTTLHLDAGSDDSSNVSTVAIPDREYLRRPAIVIQLRLHDIRSSRQLGCGPDQRPLGAWVSHLWLE